MPAITDQQALKFVDERIRPLAEKIRQLEAEVEGMELEWFSGLDFSQTGTDTIENRSSEGLPTLTWNEIGSMITILTAARDTVTETGGGPGLVEKVCVRPLRVN